MTDEREVWAKVYWHIHDPSDNQCLMSVPDEEAAIRASCYLSMRFGGIPIGYGPFLTRLCEETVRA